METELVIGKAHALKVTGANAAWGPELHTRVWRVDQTARTDRSLAIELNENAPAIEDWRATLTERRRKRLIHPLSNVRACGNQVSAG